MKQEGRVFKEQRVLFILHHCAAKRAFAFCRAMLGSAELEIKRRQFNAACEYCEAVLPLCDQSAGAARVMMRRINKAIDSEKRGAENVAALMKTKV